MHRYAPPPCRSQRGGVVVFAQYVYYSIKVNIIEDIIHANQQGGIREGNDALC